MLARNVRVGHDEVDLIIGHAGAVCAVEVKTRAGSDPVEQFTDAQAGRLRRAAGSLRISRCDLVTVRVDRAGITVRWIPAVC